MIAAHAEHIEVEPLEELGDRRLGVHKIIHKTQFIAVSCRMTQRGLSQPFLKEYFEGKRDAFDEYWRK